MALFLGGFLDGQRHVIAADVHEVVVPVPTPGELAIPDAPMRPTQRVHDQRVVYVARRFRITGGHEVRIFVPAGTPPFESDRLVARFLQDGA